MTSRRDLVLATGVDVFAREGLHGLTHGGVDRAGHLPRGTTSNYFRTRSALVQAVCEEVADRRLAEGEGPHDERVALAWYELLIAARREPWIGEAIAPLRARMRDIVEHGRPEGIPLTTGQIMALLGGIEFAELVTGEDLSEAIDVLRSAFEQPRSRATRDAPPAGTG